ncbi:MAG: HEAT repeat domain-containing protein [Myxococcota bacterium]
MLWTLLVALAPAGPVDLWVAIPKSAGTTSDISFAGPEAQCAVLPTRLRCTASGAITFEWVGDAQFSWGPPAVVQPGEASTVWVLSTPGSQPSLEGLLTQIAAVEHASNQDIDRLRRATVFTSDWTPPWPTRSALDAHLALLSHPDKRVRREVVESFHPWVAGTPFDPLPVQAPSVLDGQTLATLARDPDPGVRRRVARMIRTLRPAIDPEEAAPILETLLSDAHPGVRRASVAAVPEAVDRALLTPRRAWDVLVATVQQPRPAGRAACNGVAKMATRLDDSITDEDVLVAFEAILSKHPERAWGVWIAYKNRLPVRKEWMKLLIHDTLGMEPALVQHWDSVDPQALRTLVDAWTPTQFAERKQLMNRWLHNATDSLSDPSSAPEAP